MTTTPAATSARHNVVTGPALRGFMRRWATGVAVVTSCSAQQPVGCTVNAFTSVSLRPPMLLISLAQGSRTLAAVTARGSFAVNLLAWRQRRLADQFAAEADDRFAGVPYRLAYGVPVIDGAMAVAVCALEQVIAAADHALLLGCPQWCEEVDGADPVVFFGGQYRTVNPDEPYRASS
jgi:flavin reductase (DIM6/NTAB) family NADH-FMN oxidoreductase RutF